MKSQSDRIAIRTLTTKCANEFREYLRLIVEFSGTATDLTCPTIRSTRRLLIGEHCKSPIR